MQPINRTRRIALVAAAALALAACGGSDDETEPADEPAEAPADDTSADDTADDTAEQPADDAGEDSMDDTDGASDDATDADGAGDEGAGEYTPGDIGFRSVNLLDRPVDIYVRTTGLVEAFPIEAGVAPGAVTDYANPPADGTYIVTEAGAGDPTCVVDCDHFVADLSGAFGEGPTRTVLLYEDPFDGPRAFDLSEEVESVEAAAGSSNLLRPADPATGLVFPVGIALDEDQFGFRVGFEGVDGCVDALDQEGILVGGNQTPAYAYPGDSAGVLFFEQPDQECETPVGGPFEVTGGPGTRTLLALQGAAGSLTAIVVDLAGSVDADPGAGGDGGESAGAGDAENPTDRAGLVANILLDAPPGTDEACVADVIDQLSDADVEVIIENIDAADVPEDLSAEGLEILSSILDCAPA